MAVIFDIKCDTCHLIVEDEWGTPGEPSYGKCPDPECSGEMKQMLAAVKFNIKAGAYGRTTNGTKWEVVGTPRKYNYRNGKFGSQVDPK